MRWCFLYSRQVFCLIISLALLLFTGCLEVSEEIHVNESGEARVVITLEGDEDEFSSVVALPSEDDWQIDTLEIENPDKKEPEMKLRAERVVKPGNEFPFTFANPSDLLADKQLQFPTELKVWNEGNRTFYEFKRTYLSRRHYRFVGGDEDQINEDLEKRVLEKGIFNVPEQDRAQYLTSLSRQFRLQMLSMYEEAMGEMIFNGQLKADLLDPVSQQAEQMLEEMLTRETVLSIVSLPDDSVGIALDNLKAETEMRLSQALAERMADSDSVAEELSSALAQINLEWEITEKLDNDVFLIVVYLPGTLIKTNGKTNPDYLGTAGWEFKGKDLHDRSIPLYALSVVEH